MKIFNKDGSVTVGNGKIKVFGATIADSENVSSAFDIMRVGANISKCRKAAGMTQTELADQMNVSFQAVSNWERGQSCPDIANLMALAELFGVTVDRLLGSERAAQIVTQISEEKVPKMSEDEIKNIAPILSESQADGVVRENLKGEDGGVDPEKLSEVAPFVSEELVDETLEGRMLADIPSKILPFLSDAFIDELAIKAYEKGSIEAIPSHAIAFISENVIDRFAADICQKNGTSSLPSHILAFMSERRISELVDEAYKEHGASGVPSNLLPFADEWHIGRLTKIAYEDGGLSAIPTYFFPFTDSNTLNGIARDVLEKHGPEGLAPILAFIDSSIIENYYREKWSKK